MVIGARVPSALFAATATAKRQSFVPVDPEQLFVVQLDALALQQDM